MLKRFILVFNWFFIKKLLCKNYVEMSKTGNICLKNIYNIFVEK